MTDLETLLSRLDDCLLETEGELFALKAILGAAISVDDVKSETLRKALIGIADLLSSELQKAPDEFARKCVVAAQELVKGLFSGPKVPSRPLLTIIEGGKPET